MSDERERLREQIEAQITEINALRDRLSEVHRTLYLAVKLKLNAQADLAKTTAELAATQDFLRKIVPARAVEAYVEAEMSRGTCTTGAEEEKP